MFYSAAVEEADRVTPFGFGEPLAPRVDHIPTARIAPLRRVAWRDGPDSPWRYGSTDRSEHPAGGQEIVVVYEYDPAGYVTFTGDEIDQLHPEPIVKGSGGRSTKRIG